MGCGGNDGCEGAEFVGSTAGGAKVWLDGLYLSMVNLDVITLPAQSWVVCKDYMDVYVTLEFAGTGGASVTAKVQTAAALSIDSIAWLDVTSASATLAQTRVFKLRWNLAVPPLAVLRLVFTANGAATGVVRAMVSMKEPA